jgi:hypothetical protein
LPRQRFLLKAKPEASHHGFGRANAERERFVVEGVVPNQTLWNDFRRNGVSPSVVFGSINGAGASSFIRHSPAGFAIAASINIAHANYRAFQN